MVSWNSWTYKKKNKAILSGALLFLLLAWLLSIRQTSDLYFQNAVLQEKVGQAQSAPRKIAHLQKKMAYWDQLAGSTADTANTLQNELFKRVGKACNTYGAELRSLEFSGSEGKENHTIDTYVVVLEGSYQNILQAIHLLENQLGNGILSSVQFEKETDRYSKKSYLTAKLYIQSIQ